MNRTSSLGAGSASSSSPSAGSSGEDLSDATRLVVDSAEQEPEIEVELLVLEESPLQPSDHERGAERVDVNGRGLFGVRLEGRLVVLEPLDAEHEAGLWEAAGAPEVWKWMPARSGESPEAFHAWMTTALGDAEAGTRVPFAVLDAGSGRPIGSSSYLTLRPEHRGLEIGHTWMTRESWGTGANAEAKLLLLEHAFEGLGCMRVEFKTDALNARARSALAAIPAQFEGIFRRHMLVRDGELRDSAYYSVIDAEWPAVKTALLARVAARL